MLTTEIRPQALVSQRQTNARKPIVLLGSSCASTDVTLQRPTNLSPAYTNHRSPCNDTPHQCGQQLSCSDAYQSTPACTDKLASNSIQSKVKFRKVLFDIWGCLRFEGILDLSGHFPKQPSHICFPSKDKAEHSKQCRPLRWGLRTCA